MERFFRPKSAEIAQTEGNGAKSYTLESGETVEVSWHAFEPSNIGVPSEEKEDAPAEPEVIFLPGWSLAAESPAVQELATSFADRTKRPCLSVTSKSENHDDKDYLYTEAKAIAQLIKERGCKNIVLAGHSQGGDKSINIAELLQSDPDIQIDGLLLLDAVGLYEQEPGELTKGFAKDALVRTPVTVVHSPEIMGKAMKVSTEILLTMLRDLATERTAYSEKLTNEIQGMAEANPRLSELKIPVIIVSGTLDPISDPEKIMPKEAEEAIRQQRIDGEYHDPREVFLKENVFPHSPYIRMVKPTKLANHGMPLFRSESVARASLYLLERYKRAR